VAVAVVLVLRLETLVQMVDQEAVDLLAVVQVDTLVEQVFLVKDLLVGLQQLQAGLMLVLVVAEHHKLDLMAQLLCAVTVAMELPHLFLALQHITLAVAAVVVLMDMGQLLVLVV
jgi:hypothetical protein